MGYPGIRPDRQTAARSRSDRYKAREERNTSSSGSEKTKKAAATPKNVPAGAKGVANKGVPDLPDTVGIAEGVEPILPYKIVELSAGNKLDGSCGKRKAASEAKADPTVQVVPRTTTEDTTEDTTKVAASEAKAAPNVQMVPRTTATEDTKKATTEHPQVNSIPTKISFIVCCPVEGCSNPIVVGQGKKLCMLDGKELSEFVERRRQRTRASIASLTLLPKATEENTFGRKPISSKKKVIKWSKKARYAIEDSSDSANKISEDTTPIYVAQPLKEGWLDLLFVNKFSNYCNKMRGHYALHHANVELPPGCESDNFKRMTVNVRLWNKTHGEGDQYIEQSKFQQTYRRICSSDWRDRMTKYILDDAAIDELWQELFPVYIASKNKTNVTAV